MSDQRSKDRSRASPFAAAVNQPGSGSADAERVRRQDDLAGADDYEAGAEDVVGAKDDAAKGDGTAGRD